ncbi:fimbrial protein [Klebsiella oxytoca]|uniref:fimbrial protein n=1 Tax=Klebsiella oxytoca TaxID=571 RepID=UPI0018AC2D2A|nr:fimbrial protein [Klebsiella oxytoca]MBF8465459.1 fimbrial protein [Klebsiella oxytoca]MBZ7701851.1 fimbrial protein [Klebsiella oxytoca]
MLQKSLLIKGVFFKNTFFIAALLVCFSFNAKAFTCITASGQKLGADMSGGMIQSASVSVPLAPVITSNGTLVIDLANFISCANQAMLPNKDVIRAENGSSYIGALSGFRGTFKYYGSSFPFPLTSPTSYIKPGEYNVFQPWRAAIYLTPISTAGGVVIKAGQYFASLKLRKVLLDGAGGLYDGTGLPDEFTWNLYAENNVVIPTGGCDVSARDVTVNLPDYPGSKAIPLTVHCAENQNLGYYLSGTTIDSANSIFVNTASSSPAQGIGIQLTRNGTVVPANSTVSLGTVGTSAVNLGLTATYARTSGQVTAGNVQSIIGVTFVYQ